MRRLLTAGLFALAAFPTTLLADPVVLFTNLGPGGSYDTSARWILSDDETHEFTMAFMPVLTGPVAQVSLPIEFTRFEERRRGGAELLIELRRAHGGTPGELIEAWRLGDAAVNAHPNGGFVTLSSLTGAWLSEGEQYFLGAMFFSSNHAYWFKSLSGTGPVFDRIGGPTYRPLGAQLSGAFEITSVSDPVPEPATLLLVGGGLAAAIRRRQRNRNAATSAS